MKKLIIIGSIAVFVVTVSLLSLANMNVINLLVSDTSYGNGASENFNHKGNEEEPYNPAKYDIESGDALESLQSGLLGSGGGGGSLNLLWLLQNAKDPNKESYAYQLLQAYAKLENGEFNNYPKHVTAEAMAGSHYNETRLASFVVPVTSGFGKASSGILGKTVNGKKITLENAMRADVAGTNPGGATAVWKDANGDGYPDGPFQIEEGRYPDTNANKNRTDKKYDLYNFVDSANVVDSKFSAIAVKVAESGSAADARAIAALFGMYHNRGASGVGRMLYGLPYTNRSGVISYSQYLKHSTLESMTSDELQAALAFPKEFMKWFDASNIPLEEIVGGSQKSRGLAALLILGNGGFYDKEVGSASAKNFESLSDNVIGKVFPGQTRKTIVKYVNKNHVKKPWTVLGMSKGEYDKIYASSAISSNYEEIYRSSSGMNTAFYIDKKVTSNNYKAGNHVVVRAIEGIAAGYMIDVGVAGSYVIVELAMEAGIKSLTNGGVVDPSNPQAMYQSLDSGTYNPAGAATGNFGKFLDGLGLTGKLSVTQQAQIQALYEYSGGPYSQARRGSTYKDGLLYLDCSSFASIGLYMGLGSNKQFVTTATVNNGVWLKSTAKTNPVNGKTYPAKVVQLDKQGNPMKESTTVDNSQRRKDTEWLNYLQTGDMVNGRGSNGGHIFTYLGKNNTGKTIVLTQDVSKVNPQFSKYNPGEHFTIQAAWYANLKNAGGTGSDNSGKMGLMPLWGDTSGSPYHAMRPVYNLK